MRWFITAVAALLLGVGSAAGAPATQRYVIDPQQSQMIYRVGETFLNQGNRYNVAVGATNAVRGEVVIDRANPRNSRIGVLTIDISTFTSDNARRDNAIRERWLESARYPTATFTPTHIEGLPQTYTEGREVALRVTGDLRVRDVTRETTFATTVTLRGDVLTGTAATRILMTDFGFQPPSILGILRAENEVALELRFVARRAS